jgi:hypothetical protein
VLGKIFEPKQEVSGQFRTLNKESLMMEAVSSSETSVNFYQITRHNFPEDALRTWNLIDFSII